MHLFQFFFLKLPFPKLHLKLKMAVIKNLTPFNTTTCRLWKYGGRTEVIFSKAIPPSIVPTLSSLLTLK